MKDIRIQILSAGFGDGHNSAARALAQALEGRARVDIFDPCAAGAPWVNSALQKFYRHITTHSPKLWHRIYCSTEKQDFSKKRFVVMRKPELALSQKLRDDPPSIVVTTYPLYPYFLERHFQKNPRIPVVTVVTDSIEINAAWRKAPTDFWLVSDDFTRETLIKLGLPGERIIVTGFPVSPKFEKLTPLPADAPLDPFRVLFFPTARKPLVRSYMQAVLDSSPSSEITVVLGRNVRKLYHPAHEIKNAYPGRVRLLGWTKRVPELLCTHHLAIGKAGGATVHEALAACCPMLIHHLVPGQEEGNLTLLQKIGGGQLTPGEDDVKIALVALLKNDGELWREKKRYLANHSKPAAARHAADFILGCL